LENRLAGTSGGREFTQWKRRYTEMDGEIKKKSIDIRCLTSFTGVRGPGGKGEE